MGADAHQYVAAGTGDLSAVVGIENDQDDPCLVYAAAALFPDNASAARRGALHTYNLCTDSLESQVDLTSLCGASQLINDATKVGDFVYVTDLLGNQVLRVAVSATGSLSSASKYLDVAAPNGIEHVGSVLIVAQYNDFQLYRYDTATATGSTIRISPPTAISGDGILFDETRTNLYVVDQLRATLWVLNSLDNWHTAVLVYQKVIGAPTGSPPLDPAVDASQCTTPTAPVLVNGTLFVYCAFGFGTGPYAVVALSDAQALAPPIPTYNDSQLAVTLDWPSFVGEGLEYDAANRRLVLGSVPSGRVVGIPVPRLDAPPVTYTQSSVGSSGGLHEYYSGNASSAFSAIGLEIDQDDACRMYAASGSFGSRPEIVAAPLRGGVSSFNLCSDELLAYTPLVERSFGIASPTSGGLINDLARVGDQLYVTDYWANRVFVVTGQSTDTPFATKAFDLQAPNGIEHVGTVLIVAQPDVYKLYRFDTATRAGRQIQLVPPDAMVNGDGIRFDPSKTYLFVVNNHGALVDTVSVLVSYDGWYSARLVVNLRVGCGADGPSTAPRMIGDDLFVYCAASFGAGPYPVRVVRNIKAKIPPLATALAQAAQRWSAGDLISAFNVLTGAWGQGDQATWVGATKATTRFEIAAVGLDRIGGEDQWSFRQFLAVNFAGVGPDEPLSWVNTYDTFVADVTTRTVRAYMKSFTISNGTLIVIGEWTVTFDSDLKASWIFQNMVFSPNVGIGASSPYLAQSQLLASPSSPLAADDDGGGGSDDGIKGVSYAALALSAIAVLLSAASLLLRQPRTVTPLSGRLKAPPTGGLLNHNL